MVSDALVILLQRRRDDGICYGKVFSEQQKNSILKVIKKNFEHSVWSNPALEPVFKTRENQHLEKELTERGLDFKYLMDP